eukprot:9473592-Pyramimonas_sp.AAC.1
MESGPFSKCGSRPSAAHIRSRNLQWLHGLRALRFTIEALASAPRTFVPGICKISRIDGGSFSKRGSPPSAAHILGKQFQRIAWLTFQKWCSGAILDRQGATTTLVRGVEVPRRVLWHDSGSSRRNSQVDSSR